MKNLKKTIAMVLVIALCCAVSVGITVAYLTDRDSVANVFTVGDVEIKLDEAFEQGSNLVPGVIIEKEPTITNTGDNNAWVWATIAIPAELDNDDASKNVIHFNYEQDYVNDTMWTWQNDEGWMIDEMVIDEVTYNVYTIWYQTILVPGAETEPVMTRVYMDTNVDIDPNGDWYVVENGNATKLEWNSEEDGNPVIYVSAYAIQAEGFATVQEAYDAYQAQWGDNGVEIAPVTPVVTVSDVAGLKDALSAAEGPVVIDGNGADLDEVSDVVFPDGSVIRDVVISGDSNYGNDVVGTVTFIGCTFASTNSYAAHFDGGNGEIIFIDCHFEGWNSFGTAITGLTFENCTFGNNGKYGIVRVYQDATFTDCTFEADLEGVDTNVTGTVVHFNNCTGIEGKIYNNEDKVGTWYIDGVDVSATAGNW